jgi:hypothetical protein
VTTHAETVLYSQLHEVEAIEYLVQEGFDPEILPTELMIPVVKWAIEEYFRAGCKQAPSRESLLATWREVIEDAEVELEEEDVQVDEIGWAVDWLRAQRVLYETNRFILAFAEEIQGADIPDRVSTLQKGATELVELAMSVTSQRHQVTMDEGLRRALMRFEDRQASGLAVRGLTMGYEEIDEHTCGIHPGELALLAAGPKVGKSYFLARCASEEYQAGRRVVLFTLENSVDLTLDRLICLMRAIVCRTGQRGQATPEEVTRVAEFRERMSEGEGMLEVIHPGGEERTAQDMVKRAQILGADSLYIDQLTFMKHPNPGRKPKYEVVGDIMHDLKELISSGGMPIPCMLAHQINREGIKKAEQSDHLEMYMLADSSEAERTADWVFGLYASQVEKISGRAKLQILASRREIQKNWMITWRPGVGLSRVLNELPLS